MAVDMLLSKEEIMADFENYDFFVLEEKDIMLNEGEYHTDKGSMVWAVA